MADLAKILEMAGKLKPGEPVFLLRGKDHRASVAVMNWATRATAAGVDRKKIDEAIECAMRMNLAYTHGTISRGSLSWSASLIIEDKEEFFLLRGQDKLAADVVFDYANDAKMGDVPDSTVTDIRAIATAMRAYSPQKLPD